MRSTLCRVALPVAVLLVPLTVATSCQSNSAKPSAAVAAPSEPSFVSGHQALLSTVPSGALLTVSVGKVSHLLERLRALRALVSAGPLGKKYVDQAFAAATTKLGFDPLEADKWREQGVDVESAVAFSYLANDKGLLTVGALPDAGTKLVALLAKSFEDGNLKCEPTDKWVTCFDGETSPSVKQVDQSIWPVIAKQVDPIAQGLDVLVFGNLAAIDKIKQAPLPYFQASQAAYFGMGFFPHAVRYRIGYLNPETKGLFSYFETDPNAPSLLGALRAGPDEHLTMRFVFSPKALWELAKSKIPPEDFDKAVAGFTVVTGLDAEKDIVLNTNGELTMSMSGPHTFVMLGAKDDAIAARFVERLDGLIGTGIAALQNVPSVKIERSASDVGGKKVYAYKIHAAVPNVGPFDMTAAMAAGKGGIVFGFNDGAVQRALERLADRKPKETFLAGLPAEVRASYAAPRAGAVYVAPSYIVNLQSGSLMKMSREIYAKMGPDFAQAFDEYLGIWDLIWDTYAVTTVEQNGIFMTGWMNLL